MIANLEPRVMTRGAAYFIGRTITLIRECRNSRMALDGKGPSSVSRMALNIVTFKLTSSRTHELESDAEIREFSNVLRVAHELAADVREAGEGRNHAFGGDPVREIETLMTRFCATLPRTPDPAALAA